MAKRQLRVVELFAGVGGFRIGLENCNRSRGKFAFQVVWSNQWEPRTKIQHASDIYVERFGPDGHVNEDIEKVSVDRIPDHDILVGGFPCQDYSVASTLKNAKGLIGKKGVLWWQIHRIIAEKSNKPKLLILENVDRLISSPANQRGRDFAVMLKSLSDLGYSAEWKVINAADYGMPQRRKRIFIIAYLDNTSLGLDIDTDHLPVRSVLTDAFPSKITVSSKFSINRSLVNLTKTFNKIGDRSPFLDTGFMKDAMVYTGKSEFKGSRKATTLGDILLEEKEVPEEFFIDEQTLDRWRYLKGAKREKRVNGTTGHVYSYNEGAMTFPDRLDRPSRTVITGEGGKSPSRFKHVILTKSGKYRRLTPVELERLNMFPDNHTEGATPSKRAFFMGNALVVGIVERIGKSVMRYW